VRTGHLVGKIIRGGKITQIIANVRWNHFMPVNKAINHQNIFFGEGNLSQILVSFTNKKRKKPCCPQTETC